MSLWENLDSLQTTTATLAICTLTVAVIWLWRKRDVRKYVAVGRVSALYVYPVKSCAGVELEEAECTDLGIQYDRRWIVLDETGTFITLREEPSLALVQPSFHDGHLCLDAPGMPQLKLDTPVKDRAAVKHILIWRSVGEGMCTGPQSAEWISTFLKRPGCSVSYYVDGLKDRNTTEDEKYVHLVDKRRNDRVAFADWSPYMIMSEATIGDLNTRLTNPVTVRNYRPNIFVSGCEAYDEDDWKFLQIGDCHFTALKHCLRCLLTVVDPESGVKGSMESLKVLRSYRMHPFPSQRFPGQPCLGFNIGIDKTGKIKRGDTIYAVLKRGAEVTPWPHRMNSKSES